MIAAPYLCAWRQASQNAAQNPLACNRLVVRFQYRKSNTEGEKTGTRKKRIYILWQPIWPRIVRSDLERLKLLEMGHMI